MALQDTDLFIVQRAAQSYKMAASELIGLIGEGVKPGPNPPDAPSQGDVWFDTTTNELHFYDGTNWVPINPAPGPDAPDNKIEGTLWYDTTFQALKVWNGTEWVFSIKGAESGVSDPASGLNGQLFYNTTSQNLRLYSDGAWGDIGGGASVEVGENEPVGASEGTLWWKSDEGILYIYYIDADGTEQWVQAAGSAGGGGGGASVTVSDTAPGTATEGDLWFNSDNGRLFIYYTGDIWVDASPAGQFNGGVITESITTPERSIYNGFDLSTGPYWVCTDGVIPNPTNAIAGMTGTIRFEADGVSFASNFKFTGGAIPVITAPAIVAFYVQDSTTILLGSPLNSYA